MQNYSKSFEGKTPSPLPVTPSPCSHSWSLRLYTGLVSNMENSCLGMQKSNVEYNFAIFTMI